VLGIEQFGLAWVAFSTASHELFSGPKWSAPAGRTPSSPDDQIEKSRSKKVLDEKAIPDFVKY
jgi:hypothetical protein